MLRIPIPIALAVLVAMGAVTVYFYITVVQNPTQGAWTDRGNATVVSYTVPAGQWVVLGTFGGSSITITSNVTIDIRGDVFTAQVWSNLPLPEGVWQLSYLYIDVKPGNVYELGQTDAWQTCTSGSVIRLSNGMYMYYPNYTAPGAGCGCQWPFDSFTIDSDGMLTSCYGGVWPSGYYGYVIVNNVRSYTIKPPVHSTTVGRGTTVYYIYMRPVYGIWVRPSANAEITVTVVP